jgi:hypothetical protein
MAGAWFPVDGMSLALNAFVTTAHRCSVKRIDIMETQSPDLVQHYSASTTSAAEKSRRDDDAVADEAELEQLADRISAARSVY